jgi:hypothetical protein
MEKQTTRLEALSDGIVSYGIISLLAFYFSRIAIVLTFFMWVFWAIATKDEDEEL